MKRNKYLLILILVMLFFWGSLCAQGTKPAPTMNVGESFGNDISYPFLEKLIDTAKKYYPEFKIKATQTGMAQTAYHQAKIAWLDAFSITPSYIYNPGNSINLFNTMGSTTTFFNGYQIAFSISISSLISKPFLTHIAKQNVSVLQLQQKEYNITVEAQVKRLYITYLAAQANLRLLTHAVQDANINAEQIKHRYEEVATTLTEYSMSLTQLYTQNVSRIAAESAYYIAKINLEEIVGKPLEDIK